MSDASWKAFERRLAKRLGTVRFSKSGLGDPVPDVIAENVKLKEEIGIVIEAKFRKYVPKWITDILDQIKNAKYNKGRLKIAVIKEKGRRDDDSIVVMRWKEFLGLLDLSKKEENNK